MTSALLAIVAARLAETTPTLACVTPPSQPAPKRRRGRPPGYKLSMASRSKISIAVRRALDKRDAATRYAANEKALATRDARAAASPPSAMWLGLPTPDNLTPRKARRVSLGAHPHRETPKPHLAWWVVVSPAALVGLRHVWSQRASARHGDVVHVTLSPKYGVCIHGWRHLRVMDPFRGDGSYGGTRIVAPLTLHVCAEHGAPPVLTMQCVTPDHEVRHRRRMELVKWRARDRAEYVRHHAGRPPGRPPKF